MNRPMTFLTRAMHKLSAIELPSKGFFLLSCSLLFMNGWTSAQNLAQLDWLAGHWEGTFGGQSFESHYTTSRGGMILSVSKQVSKGQVRLFEMERFVEQEGQIILTPYPFGRASSDDFRLVPTNEGVKRARFISPEHDFPTEIIYELVGPDQLHITIAGQQNGKRVEIPAILTRVR